MTKDKSKIKREIILKSKGDHENKLSKCIGKQLYLGFKKTIEY